MKKNPVIISALIFLILLGIGFWIYKTRIFSKEVLKLEILGPEELIAGKEIEFVLKYKNNGNNRLEDLHLLFEYLSGAYPLEEEGGLTVRKELEDLYPGQEETLTFRARIFGKKDDVVVARAVLSYRPKGLKAYYESETSFSTKIKEVPLTFRFDFPSRVQAGEEFFINLNYFSNIDYPLSDLRIKVFYPSGFEFLNSQPSPLENNEWRLGVLNKAEGGRVKIKGKINSSPGESLIFRAELGLWIKDKYIVLKEDSRGLEVIKPLLMINQRVNGSPSEEYVANPGEILHYEIYFRNLGEEPFENLFLVSRLSGPIDWDRTNSENGKINTQEGMIVWDDKDEETLGFLAPEEEGKVEFWLKIKDQWPPERKKNFVIRNQVSISPAREEFITKINTKIVFLQNVYFEDEVFGNSGPIPPEVGKETTYTVIWQLKNLYNDLSGVKVRAILGEGVTVTGKIFPEEEQTKFSFDSQSREVVWDIGDLAAIGTLDSQPQKSLAFQIVFTPKEEDRGSLVELIGEATVSGHDNFTNRDLSFTVPMVDTFLPSDKSVDEEQGKIK